MRAHNIAMWSLIAAAALPACKWTEFDDLEKQAWVQSTGKPGGVKSNDYGIAIARAAKSSTDGGRLVVIGTNNATYSELVYSAEGDSSFPATQLDLQVQYGIANLAAQPILIADPTSDDVSLLVGSDNGIAMVSGSQGALKLYQFFNLAAPDAATYMTPASKGTSLPIVAVGDTVYGGFLPALAANMAQPSCKLLDTASADFAGKIHALGAVAQGASDALLAWDGGGKLYKYPTTVFDGCGAGIQPTASVATGFQPGAGSRIIPIDATHVVLQGQNANTGFLVEVDTAAMALVGSGVSVPSLASAALLSIGASNYIVAGEPTASVSGTAAGQVELYPLTAAGVGATAVDNLHDAQPDGGQAFGRSVAVMSFNSKPVLAVGASNEIFVYFRANLGDGTALYDETRQGQ